VLLTGLLASLAILALVLWMLTSKHHVSADYAPFAHCPLADPATNLCLFTQTDAGELRIGHKRVLIGSAISLRGGVHVVENSEKEIVREQFLAASDGETLSLSSQVVPGGLAGTVDERLLPNRLRDRLHRLTAQGLGAVTATIELAQPASTIGVNIQNLIERMGIAISLPVKVRLNSPFLGAACYIGSGAHPLRLALVTGWTRPPRPNRSIAGRVGRTKVKAEYSLTVIKGNSLVDNAFAAPAASGCGGGDSSSIDRAVNARLGLPAPAGANAAVLDGTLEDANASAVRASR
jgi:hypothetical protein